jgi:hypothetical protein
MKKSKFSEAQIGVTTRKGFVANSPFGRTG